LGEEEATLSLYIYTRSLKLLKRISPLGKTLENNTKAHADVHLSKTRKSLSLREAILFILLFERDCVSSSDFFVLFVFFFMGRTGFGLFRRHIVVVVVIVWKNVYDDDCGCGGERSASHASSSS
jgi:hypothetical protein